MSGRKSFRSIFSGLILKIVIAFWVFHLLGGLGSGLKDILAGAKYRNTRYSETPELLAGIGSLKSHSYPDDFVEAGQGWEYSGRDWSAFWHISRKELSAAAAELDSIDESAFVPIVEGMTREEYNIAFFGKLYRTAATENSARLENIAAGLDWFRRGNNMDDRAFVELVIRLIQEIPYEIPDELRYGFATPQEVLASNRGDCDSKALLGAVLFSYFDIDTVIYLSPAYAHAMLGINYPSVGTYKQYGGVPYYFVEMTRPGWRIGQLPDEVGDIEKWSLVPLE